MCDSSTQSVIDSIVDFKVQSGELFTAFDVSLEVQCNLKASGAFHSDNHRHRNIKNDVHKSIDRYLGNAQYERQLCDVGASTDAFVYYPQGCDPSSYVPLTRNDAPVSNSNPYVINTAPVVSAPVVSAPVVSAPVVSAPVVSSANDGGTDDAGDGRKPDSRGTVCVPNYLLRNAGFSSGDTASVYSGKDDLGNDCLVISKQVPAGVNPLTTYTVDSYCNVRITHSVFANTGNVASSYDFDGNSTSVFVKSK
jgi:hypothetical protein